MRRAAAARWAPFAAALAFVAFILLRAGTSPLDLLRYAAYAGLAVVLPGTLAYRSLRGRPRTLVEDLAMGAAVGLVLELASWAALSALDLRGFVWGWPAIVVTAFVAVPRLRKHWRVAEYVTVPLGWSWAVAGVVCLFTAYLATVFLDRNPILPTSEQTRQYLDLAYQLSLAGSAKHTFPPQLPQIAGEPLYYHWFGYAHMAMTSMVGHIDLPVVALRLAVPALCALAIVLTAVVGWRVSDRPYVGAGAAALFFAVGEFHFTNPVAFPFGTQATFVVWHGMSMIYSWVLLLALIAPLAGIVAGRGRAGTWTLAGLLLLGSSGAKASSLPVVAVALAVTAVALLLARRRIPWAVVGAGALTGAAQLFASGVLYRFQTYGLGLGPLQGLETFWRQQPGGEGGGFLVVLGVWLAFVLNMLLRTAGIVPLVWLRRGRLTPPQWLLVAGALAGPALYLVLSQPAGGNEYFTRSGFAFGVIASAWGYALAWERAAPSVYARGALGAGTVALVGALVAAQLAYAAPAPVGAPYGPSFAPLLPILSWAAILAGVGVLAALAWLAAQRHWPLLRGRGPLVALTAILVAGAPGLLMDSYKSIRFPNGGAYATIPLPHSRVEAARWVRDHSEPTDVLATNVHCIGFWGDLCDSRSFWLSAYSERAVLVEGWGFDPREATRGLGPFWEKDRLALNDAAITATTEQNLSQLREYGVRWIVVDRNVSDESPELRRLANLRFDNGRLAVYQLP